MAHVLPLSVNATAYINCIHKPLLLPDDFFRFDYHCAPVATTDCCEVACQWRYHPHIYECIHLPLLPEVLCNVVPDLAASTHGV